MDANWPMSFQVGVTGGSGARDEEGKGPQGGFNSGEADENRRRDLDATGEIDRELLKRGEHPKNPRFILSDRFRACAHRGLEPRSAIDLPQLILLQRRS